MNDEMKVKQAASRLSRWVANGMQDHSDDSDRRDALRHYLIVVLAEFNPPKDTTK